MRIPKSSREIIKALQKEGWKLVRITGSHCHFHHPEQKGIVTIPHPKKDLAIGTVRSIERQSGCKLLK